ncbi:MAG: TRL domain-containing protein [Flavobacteriales bacterium]|jgi:hypothetical protein
MKKISIFAILTSIMLFGASCSTTMTVAVSDAELGSKRGVSTTGVFLGIPLNSNFSVKEAAENGGITGPIATVDVKVTSFIIFQKRELIVTAK